MLKASHTPDKPTRRLLRVDYWLCHGFGQHVAVVELGRLNSLTVVSNGEGLQAGKQ